MLNIYLPSESEVKTLNYQLEDSIILDIKNAIHDGLYNRIEIDSSIIDYNYLLEIYSAILFVEKQRKLEKNKTYIGPELFRWLAKFSYSYKKNNVRYYSELYLELAPLLYVRMLVYHKNIKEAMHLTLAPTNIKGVYIPQISEDFLTDIKDFEFLNVNIDATESTFTCNDFEKNIKNDDILKLVDGYFDQKDYLSGNKLPIYLHQSGYIVREMVEELNNIASAPINSNENLSVLRFCDLKNEKYQEIIQQLASGYKYIKQYSTELYKETLVSLKGITLLDGNRYVGSSDICYQGIALLNPDQTWTDVTFADHILHESAHTILHAYNEMNPIMYNPFEVNALSPIRPDPRPLYGTFHATYVFMKLTQFFTLVSKKDESEEVMFRLNRHLKGFYDGMEVIAEYAELTPAGFQLFKSMCDYYQELIKLYPSPDPKKYQNESKDYVV